MTVVGREDVAIATVTYGDRADVIGRVLDGIQAQTAGARVRRICVCDNGSTERTARLLAERGAADPRITVLRLPRNLGSAGGFHAAIRAAVDSGARYVWCLDDDNVPAADALARLFDARDRLGEGCALFSFRESRPMYRLLAAGASLHDALGRPYNFMGFSLLDLPKLVVRRATAHRPSAADAAVALVTLPYAAYGGFFFAASDVARVGLPRATLFTGADDHEFTRRFVAHGIAIHMVTASRVVDVDGTWEHRTGLRRVLGHKILFDHEADKIERIYYPVRNGVWFRSQVLGWRRHPVYLLNGVVYLAAMFSQAVVMRLAGQRLAWRSFTMLWRGVRDGLRGVFPEESTA